MERRLFLGVGAGAAALAGCGTLGGPREGGLGGLVGLDGRRLDDGKLEPKLGELDRAMAAVEGWKLPLDGIARPGSGALGRLVDQREATLRKGLRSLVLVSAAHDLSGDEQAHPAVQERLWRGLPDMDEAVLGAHAQLRAMSAKHRKAVHERLKKSPGLALEITRSLIDDAKRVEAPLSGRVRLRNVATQAAWQLERQGPTAIVQDFDARVNRAARSELVTGPLQRELRTRLGEEAFWAHQERLARMLPPAPQERSAERLATSDSPEPYWWNEPGENHDHPDGHENESRGGTATVGGIMMGVGLGIGLIGFAIGDIGGAVVATVGGVILLIGFIVLIIGLIMLANDR